MEVFQNIFSLFFSSVQNVVDGFPYYCYFVIAAFVAALIFNLIHELMGGSAKRGR